MGFIWFIGMIVTLVIGSFTISAFIDDFGDWLLALVMVFALSLMWPLTLIMGVPSLLGYWLIGSRR